MKSYNVAIVGATGLVGQEFIKILQQRKFPVEDIRLLASDRSVGKKVLFNDREHTVQEANYHSFEGIQIVLIATGNDISLHFSPIAVKAGAIVIDNSSAFRMDRDTPLVIPEVNPMDLKSHKGIIANPNCSTVQMVVALNPLHKVNPIKRVIVDTYQAVAGTGSAAIEELNTQSEAVLKGRAVMPHVYPHQIAFNLLPEIDVFLDNGYSKEEWKMVQETRKIMHAPELAISATTVRVPVFIGHSEAIHVEFTRDITPEEVRAILADAPGIRVQDEPLISLYPQPWSVAGQDEVFVGRIRKDISRENGIAMWVVADNVRKGAALNAIQIAEKMIKMGLI